MLKRLLLVVLFCFGCSSESTEVERRSQGLLDFTKTISMNVSSVHLAKNHNHKYRVLANGRYTGSDRFYANNISYERDFYFPSHTKKVTPEFSRFITNANQDVLRLQHIEDGNVVGERIRSGHYRDFTPVQRFDFMRTKKNKLRLKFNSDSKWGQVGWRLSSYDVVQNAIYDSLNFENEEVGTVVRPVSHEIKTNKGVDGVLSQMGDEIHFNFAYDPSKKHIVHMDYMSIDGYSNFDVFVSIGNSSKTIYPSKFGQYDYSGEMTGLNDRDGRFRPLNEIVVIPPGLDGNRVYVSVISKSGSGHFRLTPNRIEREIEMTVGTGGWRYENEEDLHIPNVAIHSDMFAEMSRLVYAATEGTVLVSKYTISNRDNCGGYLSRCDIQLLTGEIPAGRVYEWPYHIWLDVISNEPPRRSMTDIARTFTHEMGHAYLGLEKGSEHLLPDEYRRIGEGEDSTLESATGHTIMSGSSVYQILLMSDFSVSLNANKDPYCFPEYTRTSHDDDNNSATPPIVLAYPHPMNGACILPYGNLEGEETDSNWRRINTQLGIPYPNHIIRNLQPDEHTYANLVANCSTPNALGEAVGGYDTHSKSISFKGLVTVEVIDSLFKRGHVGDVVTRSSGIFQYNSTGCEAGLRTY